MNVPTTCSCGSNDGILDFGGGGGDCSCHHSTADLIDQADIRTCTGQGRRHTYYNLKDQIAATIARLEAQEAAR